MRARIFSRTARLVLAVIVVTSMVAVVAPGAGVAATTYYYVDPVSGSDAPGGTTEGTAFKTITYALGVGGAVDGDTIMCLPGTYSDSSNSESFPIDVNPGVALVSRDGAKTTIIDAEDTTIGTLTMFDPIANTTLKGFTIRNGGEHQSVLEVERDVTGSAPGWPLIEDNVFESNEILRNPVVLLDDGVDNGWLQPRIIDNEFVDVGEIGEQLPDEGGAIYVGAYVDLLIEGNYFDNVNVNNYGGAIYLPFGPNKMDVIDNAFFDCYAGSDGGAISIDAIGAELVEVTIEGNYFKDNTAGNNGGIIYAEDADTLVISQNKMAYGTSGDDGGAIYSADCTATVENNWIYGNTCAAEGGAMYVNNTPMAFINNTVYGNNSTGGVLGWAGIHKEGTGSLQVINSILWGHGSEDVEGSKIRNSCTEDTNLVGSGNSPGLGANANIHTDPLFFDMNAGDLRLKLGSPCIDIGDDTAADDEDIFGWTRPQDGDGDGNAVSDLGAWEKPEAAAGRIAGADRYATAADAAMDAFDGPVDTAVIASGQNFPDALSAAGLCGSYEAPLLLTRTASLPAATAQALSDLDVTDVFIVGGTGAVSSAVESALKVDYNVTRIAGATRYDTSALVAREIAEHDGGDFSQRAFFARGDSFPDALAVSPYSYSDISPILLVRPTVLPSVIAIAMNDLDIEEGYVCGGTGAVSPIVKAGIDVVLVANGGTVSERWGGADRYATAVTIATKATEADYGSFEYVGIATGMNFPDALAGGVAAGAAQGAVLLTRTSSLPAATSAELTKRKAQVVWCEILGGEGAVASSVKTSIESALGW